MSTALKRDMTKNKINPESVYELAKMGATVTEISKIFRVSHQAINRAFQEEFDAGQSELHQSLRRTQLECALKDKNINMLIHLGKTVLKQNAEVTVTHEVSELNDISTSELIDIVSAANKPTTH